MRGACDRKDGSNEVYAHFAQETQLKINKLQHVLVGKVRQLFRDML